MKIIIFITFLLFTLLVSAQISYGDYPYVLKHESIDNLKVIQLSQPNLDSLKKEDEITDGYKDIPWRFGSVIFEEIDFFEKADRTVLLDGQLRYRLKITSKNALTLNFNYSEFDLAEGAQLFIHNSDFSQTIGAFTHQNNPKRIDFATTVTEGSEATIEVLVPQEVENQSTIKISSIVYGYRSLTSKAANFGRSGACNIDVNCEEGEKWQNEKRSVVMILNSNNSRICSGALINNVRQDSTPYILSAFHCPINPSTSIYIFNYESFACSPRTNGPMNQSVVGSELKASNYKSDFALLELFSKPPAAYDVFYSGWDATGNIPKTGTGIHHPVGDVKKISLDFDILKSDQYQSYTLPDGHWAITDWDKGTTQPTSSGSPLYNEWHRIVGQLNGGAANCGNDFKDYYGKLSNSWDLDKPANNQLKRWLDPDSTNILIMDGLDPNPSTFNRDLEILGFDGTYRIECGTQPKTSLLISNRGNQLVHSFELGYQINNVLPRFITINKTINKNQLVDVHLPSVVLNSGINDLNIFINRVNGMSDQNKNNDSINNPIYTFTPYKSIDLTFKTDNYGSELSYSILDSLGNITLYKDGHYKNVNGGQLYNYNYCLSNGCYTLKLNDSYNDGYCCNIVNGFTLITLGNDTLLFDNSFNSGSKTMTFCIRDSSTSIAKNSLNNSINIYPNPTKDQIFIEQKGQVEIERVQLLNLKGQSVLLQEGQVKTIRLEDLQKGMYFLRIETNQGISIKKVVKQ